MKRAEKLIIIFSISFFLLAIFQPCIKAGDDAINSVSEDKIRIAYVEGYPWGEFAGTFHALIRGLEERGIISGIDELPYQLGQQDSRGMWHYLVEHAESDYLKFVDDAHYSFHLDGLDVKEDLLSRLSKGHDIDLVLSMGTYSGQVLAVDEHQVPTLNFSSSNAVFAEIVDSAEDSGRDHIWAHVDLARFSRPVKIFYDIFEFESLGIVYEDSALGRAYADVPAIKDLAEENNFELVTRFVDEPYASEEDNERYYSEVLTAHQELAAEVDAMLIAIASIEAHRLFELIEVFYKEQIPVFSQLGTQEVKYGALMSVGSSDFSEIGQFGAGVVEEVIFGASPRELEQEFVITPMIILNLKAAEMIDYQIPFEILLVADEIYHEISQ